MSYVDDSLVEGEQIVHRAHVSWWSQFGLVLLQLGDDFVTLHWRSRGANQRCCHRLVASSSSARFSTQRSPCGVNSTTDRSLDLSKRQDGASTQAGFDLHGLLGEHLNLADFRGIARMVHTHDVDAFLQALARSAL